MTTTVQQLIEAGYARSTANDPGKLATDLELINHLNRDYQARYALWAIKAGDSSLSTVQLTFAGAPPAIVLPNDIIDLVRIELSSTGAKVNVIPSGEKDRAFHLAPAVYRQGLNMVSRNASGDPIIGTQVTAYLDDAPLSLTALSQSLDARFPVRYENLLVLGIALYLDAKDEERSQADHDKLQKEFDRYEQIFNTEADVNTSALERDTQPRST